MTESARDDEVCMAIRRPDYRRNQNLEALLRETNALLGVAEQQALRPNAQPEQPVVLIMGAPRSGTTLLMQWLANTGAVAYPSNILARFYNAPVIGARIQRLLTDPDYAFRDELFDLRGDLSYESNLGKTRGALSPSEFWYFWRRFFPLELPEPLTAQQLEQIDTKLFLAELAALTDFYRQPFVLKGMLLNFHIEFLARLSSKFIFIHLVRDTLFNAQSLLQARQAYFGDLRQWYSTKPAEFAWLKDLDPFYQVVGQCLFTNRAIRNSLAQLPANRYLALEYEAFCAEPKQVYSRLVATLNEHGAGIDLAYQGPECFPVRNEVVLPSQKFSRLQAIHAEMASGPLAGGREGEVE